MENTVFFTVFLSFFDQKSGFYPSYNPLRLHMTSNYDSAANSTMGKSVWANELSITLAEMSQNDGKKAKSADILGSLICFEVLLLKYAPAVICEHSYSQNDHKVLFYGKFHNSRVYQSRES